MTLLEGLCQCSQPVWIRGMRLWYSALLTFQGLFSRNNTKRHTIDQVNTWAFSLSCCDKYSMLNLTAIYQISNGLFWTHGAWISPAIPWYMRPSFDAPWRCVCLCGVHVLFINSGRWTLKALMSILIWNDVTKAWKALLAICCRNPLVTVQWGIPLTKAQ